MNHPIPVDPVSIDELLTEFMGLLRAGEFPAISDFCARAGADAAILKPLLETATTLEHTRQRIDSKHQQPAIDSRLRELSNHQLGDYRLIREAGRGGMGVVYEAIEVTLQRRVALKILDARNVSNPVWLKRFQLEARAAAQLHHTNIVPVFSVGDVDGIHYYAMPFIDGDPLSRVMSSLREKSGSKETRTILESDLQSRDLHRTAGIAADSVESPETILMPGMVNTDEVPPTTVFKSRSKHFAGAKQKEAAYYRRVATIGIQVAEALDHAYQQGVLHRDIKPANLILALDGTVWVTDFGLARMHDSDDLTNTGEVLGTLRYLAPERLHGTHTVQGDIYGLGMTLYELLTLKPAFAATDRPELLRQVLEQTPVALRKIDPAIPSDLATIVTRAIARDVRDRYQLPDELITELRLFMEDRPILSRRVNTAQIVWRWCRKNPGVAALLTAVVSLLIVISVGIFLWGQSLREERDVSMRAEMAAKISEQDAIAARQKAVLAEGIAVAARKSAEDSDRQRSQELFNVYQNDMESKYRSRIIGHRLDGIQIAKSALTTLPLEELTPLQRTKLRNTTIACLSHADLTVVAQYRLNDQLGHTDDIDPSFRVLAFPADDNQTILRWLDGSRPDQLLKDDSISNIIINDRWFSPCGRWLLEAIVANHDSRRVRVWDWRHSKLALSVDTGFGAETPCFHPDGHQLLLVKDARIHVYDLETSQLLRMSSPRFKNGRLAISRDGKYLSSLIPMHPPELVKFETLEVMSISSEPEHSNAAAWSPGEPSVLIGTKEGELSLWDLHGQQSLRTNTRYPATVSEIKYSPGGRFLAIGTFDGNTHFYDTNGDRELFVVQGKLRQFSQDERRFCVRTSGEVVVFEYVPSPSFTSIRQPVQSAEFSPDGNWLALSGQQGVELYSTNPPTLECNLGLDESGPVAWHPVGRELATFGMFSHVNRWPVATIPGSSDLSIGPPASVAINLTLARLGADNRVPQHWGRHAIWHPDGKRLFYADSRNSHVWQFDVVTQKNEIVADLASASFVAVSPDGKWIAGASSPIENVHVWDAVTHEYALEVSGWGRMAFSPDGRILAVSSHSEFRFYNTLTWEIVRSWPSDAMNAFHAAPIAFQPGGDVFAAVVSGQCIRLFETDSGEPIADLPMSEDADINWLSFSPDGARLAITRAERDVLIWNLASLRNELSAIGLPTPSLPMTEKIAQNRQVRKLDRGSNLASLDGWWSGHELLARFEAIKLNFPDAIDRLDIVLNVSTTLDPITRARLLIQRGEYHLLNNSSVAACADFRDAMRLNPADDENSRRLIELLLFGPDEIRDADAARLLLQDLVSQDESKIQDRLNLILTLIGVNRLRAARDLFEQINDTTIQESNAIAQAAYHCVRIYIRRKLPGAENASNLVNDATSIAETKALADKARENASLLQSAAVDAFCQLLDP